jgi:sodium-dependent dicarboxylate transporter 2/3/5
MSTAERRVLLLFGAAVLLWVTRADVQLDGERVLRGWASRLGLQAHVDDGTVAVAIAILAFLVPSAGRGSPRIMDWSTARAMPYEILLLLGGGVAIAGAFSATGLSQALGGAAAPALEGMTPWLAIAATCCLLTFLTEVTSNTAITAIMLPVLSATALSAHIDPRLLLLPATISASCAFMFPIATPPNAVVFASGRVSFGQMARAGVLLNLLGVVLLTAVMWFWVVPLLGIEPGAPPPAWADPAAPLVPRVGPR